MNDKLLKLRYDLLENCWTLIEIIHKLNTKSLAGFFLPLRSSSSSKHFLGKLVNFTKAAQLLIFPTFLFSFFPTFLPLFTAANWYLFSFVSCCVSAQFLCRLCATNFLRAAPEVFLLKFILVYRNSDAMSTQSQHHYPAAIASPLTTQATQYATHQHATATSQASWLAGCLVDWLTGYSFRYPVRLLYHLFCTLTSATLWRRRANVAQTVFNSGRVNITRCSARLTRQIHTINAWHGKLFAFDIVLFMRL